MSVPLKKAHLGSEKVINRHVRYLLLVSGMVRIGAVAEFAGNRFMKSLEMNLFHIGIAG